MKAGFQVQADGGPLLFFRSAADENSFAVALIGDDQPIMSMAAPDGAHRMFLGLDDSGFGASLVFLSVAGMPIARFP